MSLLTGLLRRVVRRGTLRLVDADGEFHVFTGEPADPAVTVRLHDRRLHRDLALWPDPVAGEAYMAGTLTIEDGGLYDFLHLIALNEGRMAAQPLQRMTRRVSWALRRVQQLNTPRLARRHISAHYDRTRALYELFLDADLQYSCAYFTDPGATVPDAILPGMALEEAQDAKKRHIAAKLLLRPGQRVLDIGCGWGGLALALAQRFDVHVTGITLSGEQHSHAVQHARAAGLAGRVRFKLCDYREVDGRFDRIVSVGMFEHVGAANYPAYFRRLRHLLTDDGVALIQSIGRKEPPTYTSPWIRKHIFPGGYIPALSEVFAAVEGERLWVTDVEILRLHYAETVAEWRRRFAANRARAAALYDERFCRMWELYLAASELTFRAGQQMVFQMQLCRDVLAVPLTRAYMAEAERAMASPAAAEPARGVV